MAAISNSKLSTLIVVAFIVMGTMNLWGQEFAGGNGSEADPWQIETVEHLNNVRNFLGEEHSDKHFIQTADINLEDFLWDDEADDYINDGEGWEPIGDETNRFTGKYNGNSKTISSMFISRLEADNQGFFGFTEGAVITDLGVIDGDITGGEAVGVLAGLINNTTVTNCYTTGNVTGLSYTGGLAGRSSDNSEVFDCHSDAAVTMYDSTLAGMVYVEGGTFNPTLHYHNPRNYVVTLSSFYMAKYEVTQTEWTSVMGGIYDPYWTGRGQGPTHPAYHISWFDAIEYCNRLSIREGLTPAYSYSTHGTNPDDWPADWNTRIDNHTNVSCNWNANGFRLPTEMEWEFAARGGVPAQNAGTFNTDYAGSNNIDLVAWYSYNSDRQSHPVGTKLPNELDLYDMTGNVAHLIWDIYDRYPTGVYNNPTGPTIGSERVIRGGSWRGSPHNCLVLIRTEELGRRDWIGFRVCRRIP